MGRLGGGDDDALEVELKAAATGDAQGPDGSAWSWGRLMRTLHDSAGWFLDARNNFRFAGDEVEAERAEVWRQKVIQVIDALSELYREWPDLGLDERGRLGLPHAMFIIAGIVGAGVIAWAYNASQAAQALRDVSIAAINVCAADPNSEACIQARAIADGAQDAIKDSGDSIATAIGGGLGLIAIAAGAAIFLSRK